MLRVVAFWEGYLVYRSALGYPRFGSRAFGISGLAFGENFFAPRLSL